MNAPDRSAAPRLALLVLLLGATVSVGLGWRAAASAQTAADQQFEAQTDRFVSDLQLRLQRYEYGLRGARGAVVAAGGDAITRQRFYDYMQTRDLPREFPGTRGFGFIRRIQPTRVDGFLTAARAEDRPDFQIRELEPHSGDHFVIQYIEPEDVNQAAIGLDVASNPARANAAREAMWSGEARITAPITLVQAQGKPQGGFLLILPVYRSGDPIADPASREAATLGWAYAPLVIDEILAGLEDPADAVTVSLADTTTAGPGEVFFGARFEKALAQDQRTTVRMLTIWGRQWEVRMRETPNPSMSSPTQTAMNLAMLLVSITLLSAALIFVVIRGRERRGEVEQQQAALMRGIVDAAPQAILVIDEHGLIKEANSRVTELFGYERSDLLGQAVDILLPGHQRAAHRALRERYDGRPRPMGTRGDLQARHQAGHSFFVEVSLSRLQVGSRHLVIAGAMDVTEQKEALTRLQESETRWRSLANSMPQFVWTCTAEGSCDFLSARWVEYTGIPEQDQLGYAWLEQVHPEDRESLNDAWQHAVLTLTTFHVEFRIRRHDGVYRWFDTQAVPLLDSSGALMRWIGANTDIEERRQAEESLRMLNATLESRVAERTEMLERARRDLRSILDAMPSMVGYWDRDQINRFANHAYREWFGLDAESIPGKTLREVLGPEIYERNRPYIEGALAGQVQHFERQIGPRTSDARYLPDVVDGEVRGFYAFVSDVTELKNATRAAEAASAAKSAFLANMSHEIRTPMNAVMNLAYLLEQSPLSFEQRDLLAKMRIASRSLLGLINDVLDLSKIEAGQAELTQDAFSLQAQVDEALQLMTAQASAKQLALSAHLDPRLPAYVRGDAMRLNQILVNLIGNAVKFTDRGSVRLSVIFEGMQDHRAHLRFEVVDTGIGIPPAVQSTLFEPFVQADSSTMRRFGGSGLGLAIVKRLVTLMGGEVGLRSEEGAGSTFWFVIPFKPESEATLAGTSPQVLEALIADDSEEQRQALSATARALGWRVESVESGEGAIERIEDRLRGARPYDVLLIDWRMPGMDGLQTLAEVRRRHSGESSPAVILVTAYDRDELARAADAALADAILPKPVDTSTLFNAVHEAIARRQVGDARRAIPAPVAGIGTRRLPGVRVLLVDDSLINLEVGQKILEREGAQVELATNGQMAVDAVRHQPDAFDLVLMDVQMPVLDGHAATRAIRSELALPDLPIVALTAGALLSERQRAFEAGMNEFVAKPFDAELMIGVIRKLVEQRRGAPLGIGPTAQAIAGPSMVERPPPMEGLDLSAVGARLGDDWSLFRSLLQRLFDEFSSGWSAVAAPLDEAARRALAQRAHKLRGVAGNVGADRLRELAGRLETALRDTPDGDPSGACGAIDGELRRLLDATRHFLATAEPLQTNGTGNAEPLHAQALAELRRQLRQQSLDASDTYATLAPALRARLGGATMASLDRAMRDLRFPEALKLLNGIHDGVAADGSAM